MAQFKDSTVPRLVLAQQFKSSITAGYAKKPNPPRPVAVFFLDSKGRREVLPHDNKVRRRWQLGRRS